MQGKVLKCDISWFTPTGGASGLNTSATTKIVPVLVLLWKNFCNQVILLAQKILIFIMRNIFNKIK